MKKLALAALTFALITTAPGLAAAQAYLSLFGGANHLTEGEDTASEIKTRYDNGWVLGGALGMHWNILRIEGELAWRRNNASSMDFSGGLNVADGPLSATSAMANAIVDFTWLGLSPYAGAGIGAARVTADHTLETVPMVSATDTVMAWQLIGGTSFAIAPTRDLFLEYRYFQTKDPSFIDVDGETYTTQVHSHSFNVGFRFNF